MKLTERMNETVRSHIRASYMSRTCTCVRIIVYVTLFKLFSCKYVYTYGEFVVLLSSDLSISLPYLMNVIIIYKVLTYETYVITFVFGLC